MPRFFTAPIHRSLRRRRHASMAVLGALLMLVAMPVGSAQPPGTTPPHDAEESEGDSSDSGIGAEAFFFLDQTGTPVMMPGMSWEELERLRDLREGIDSREQAYIFESLVIEGSASGARAELDVTMRLTVEPTGGRRVAIPLQMAKFNLLRVRNVSGVDGHWVTVAEDGSGYLLWVQASERSSVTVELSVAARVEGSPSGRLKFDLPEVPSVVRVEVDQPDLGAEVVGRGDEVVQTESLADGVSRMVVESSGGNFDLRWTPVDRGTDDAPMLEADSRVRVRWDGPQDQPIAEIQMTVRNRRGTLAPFSIRLPPRSILLEPPTLDEDSLEVEIPAPVVEAEGSRLLIPVPEDERLQRVDLSMDLQLENTGASADSPLQLVIPTVIDAFRHEGDLEVQTGTDYRLRWESQRWVQSVVGEGSGEGSSRPLYAFRFDRDSFQLPIWLSAQRRQLRLTGESVIELHESSAQLTMEIRPSGQSVDGRITLDPAGWKLRAISDLETGEPIDSFDSGDYRELTLNTRGPEEPAPVRILAETEIDDPSGSIRMRLPRIVEQEQSVLVQESLLTVRTGGRNVFVADLAESSGVDRVNDASDGSEADSIVSRFRMLPSESAAELVGTLVEQPQRITLAGNATIELDGHELQTTVDWTVTGQFDLEGRLLIQVPGPPAANGSATEEARAQADAAAEVNGSGSSDAESRRGDVDSQSDDRPAAIRDAAGLALEDQWSVSVDDVAAVLRPLGNDRYELISDRLDTGPVLVRWRLRQGVSEDGTGEQRLRINLPRPVLADASIEGDFPILLRGDERRELIADDSPGTNPLSLDTLPRDPVRVRLRTLATASRDLAVRQAIMRTAIGGELRHEQVLANVQGGDSFEVSLPLTAEKVVVEARVDGERTGVRRLGNRLVVALPSDDHMHAIDMRVWLPIETAAAVAPIRPVLGLPAGVGRVYWQLTVPKDAHVVWASPTVGRAMQWRFDKWWLYRDPIETDDSLGRWIGTEEFSSMPPGNRYLYVGSNVANFQVSVASRGLIWMVVGAIVLFLAAVLTYVPQTRHPLVAVLAAVLLAGMIAVAPDAAVLAGQLGGLALVLVIVMLGMRALLAPKPSHRALSPAPSVTRSEGSTHSAAGANSAGESGTPPPSHQRGARLTETHSMASPAASGEGSQ